MKAIVGALALVAALGFGSVAGAVNAAFADELTVAPATTSLPYVEDVNPWKGNTYMAVVVCYGGYGKFELRSTDMKTRKAVKAKRIGSGQWMVPMKPNREYKLSVRIKGTPWKSIGYRIYG